MPKTGAPSAAPLRQLDDDPLRTADVAELIAVLVALDLANEPRATSSQAGDDGVDVVDVVDVGGRDAWCLYDVGSS